MQVQKQPLKKIVLDNTVFVCMCVFIDSLCYCDFNTNTGCGVHSWFIKYTFIKYFQHKISFVFHAVFIYNLRIDIYQLAASVSISVSVSVSIIK